MGDKKMLEVLELAKAILDNDGCRDGYSGAASYDDATEAVDAAIEKLRAVSRG